MKQISSGTPGLDELLGGGFPARRNILISGSSGTGKTMLGMQFLNAGVAHGEAGLLISFEQDEDKLTEDFLETGIDINALKKTGKFRVIGGAIGAIQKAQEQTKAKKEDIHSEIRRVITDLNAKRVVVDSVNLYFMLFSDPEKRDALAQLSALLSELKCTALLTSEVPEGSKKLSSHGFEEFVVDGAIVLYRIAFENTFERAAAVVKMRGINHSKAIRAVKITNEGLKIYPELEPYHKDNLP